MGRAKDRGRGRHAGYTLVELMMIVAIIGISVVVFTPSFSRAMADRKVSLAARELIRIGRRARADTFGYLRAHLVWIDPQAGSVQLLRGPTNSCALTNWGNVAADCAVAGTLAGQRCVETLTMASLSGAGRTISMWEESVNSGGTTEYDKTRRALCFQPSGVMMFGTGANVDAASGLDATGTRLRELNTGAVAGGFVFSFVAGTTKPGSNAAQRVHRVLFPQGGSARSLR